MARTKIELKFDSFASFPTSGASGQLYIATDNNKIYRWDGSIYQEIGVGGAGPGDVVGPASAIDENIVVFDSTTGKLIKDSGVNQSELMLNTTPLNQTAFVSKGGNDSTGTVGRIDLPYLTIQAAIDAITDATTTKRYVVKVSPGDYAEAITMKDYVVLEGENTAVCRITGTSGTLVTMAGVNSRIAEFSLDLTTAANGSKCIDATAGGFVLARNMDFNITSAVNGAICQFIDADCDNLIMADFAATATMTGTSAGVNTKRYFEISGTTVTSVARFAMTINDGDADDNIVAIYDESTGRTKIETELIELNATNVAYSGTAAAYAPFGTGSSSNTLTAENVTVTSAGNGTGYAVFMSSGGTGISEVKVATIDITGFATNRAYFVNTGDTLYAVSNIVNAADGNLISGTLKSLDINSITGNYEPVIDFDITGDVDISGDLTVPTITNAGSITITATDSAINLVTGTGAGDDFTINTTGFVYEGDTGRVGIGNNAPEHALHVTSGGSFTGGNLFEIRGTGTQGAYIGVTETGVQRWGLGIDDGDDDLKIKEDGGTGTARVTFQAGGNVGINETTPDNLLHISSQTAGRGIIVQQSSSSDQNGIVTVRKSSGTISSPTVVTTGHALGQYTFQGYDGDTWETSADILALATGTIADGQVPSEMRFRTTTTGGSLTTAMTIDSAQNVGIGLTPTANMAGLSVEAGLLTLKETTTPTADTNYGKIYTKTDNSLYFQDGAGSEQTVLTSSSTAIISTAGTPTGADRIIEIVSLTSAEYAAISGSEVATTLYIITDA